MNIIETHVYQSATLPEAPERATRAEAEADEARGVELAAYVALLPGLTAEQWDAAGDLARRASQDASRDLAGDLAARAAGGATRIAARIASRDAAWDTARSVPRSAAWSAAWGANALIVRDLISAKHFDILTAPMRAAGIDFDNLAPRE